MGTAFKAYGTTSGVSKTNPKAFTYEGRSWAVTLNKEGEPTGVISWMGKGFSVTIPANILTEVTTKEFCKVAEEAATATAKAIKSGDMVRKANGFY